MTTLIQKKAEQIIFTNDIQSLDAIFAIYTKEMQNVFSKLGVSSKSIINDKESICNLIAGLPKEIINVICLV
jgi:hypothetical protein